MSINGLPAGVRDLAALVAFGNVRGLAPHPLTAVCLVKHPGGTDSIWIDLGSPGLDYDALWRTVYPTALLWGGLHAVPLISREEAQRRGFRFVRLGLPGVAGARAGADGNYVLTGVSHSATDST